MLNDDEKMFYDILEKYYRERPGNQYFYTGWMNRVDKILNVYFDNNYFDMQIDAINGRINT